MKLYNYLLLMMIMLFPLTSQAESVAESFEVIAGLIESYEITTNEEAHAVFNGVQSCFDGRSEFDGFKPLVTIFIRDFYKESEVPEVDGVNEVLYLSEEGFYGCQVIKYTMVNEEDKDTDLPSLARATAKRVADELRAKKDTMNLGNYIGVYLLVNLGFPRLFKDKTFQRELAIYHTLPEDRDDGTTPTLAISIEEAWEKVGKFIRGEMSPPDFFGRLVESED